MFDILGGAVSLRRTRERLEKTLGEPSSLWSYPVVREKCGCGAYTETVLFDDERAAKVFSAWRKEHGCPLRKESAKTHSGST